MDIQRSGRAHLLIAPNGGKKPGSCYYPVQVFAQIKKKLYFKRFELECFVSVFNGVIVDVNSQFIEPDNADKLGPEAVERQHVVEILGQIFDFEFAFKYYKVSASRLDAVAADNA